MSTTRFYLPQLAADSPRALHLFFKLRTFPGSWRRSRARPAQVPRGPARSRAVPRVPDSRIPARPRARPRAREFPEKLFHGCFATGRGRPRVRAGARGAARRAPRRPPWAGRNSPRRHFFVFCGLFHGCFEEKKVGISLGIPRFLPPPQKRPYRPLYNCG